MSTATRAVVAARPWKAAWRRHRAAVLVQLGLVALLIVAVVVMGIVAAGSCSPASDGARPPCFPLRLTDWWGVLRVVLLFAPAVTALVSGVGVFAADSEQRTDTFVLTQAVGRVRWWMVSVVTAGLPGALGFLVLGLLTGQLLGRHGDVVQAAVSPSVLASPTFEISGPVPAATFAAVFLVASAIGLLVRRTAAATALALIVVVVGLSLLSGVRTDLVPHDRVVVALDTGYPATTEQDLRLQEGYLNSAGQERVFGWDCEFTATDEDGYLAQEKACLEKAGMTARFVEFIPADRHGALVAVYSGVLLAAGVVAAAAGLAVFRRRDV